MPGTFTAVDLSRLPPPTVIEQVDYEALLADAIAQLKARDPVFDALVESDPAHKILQVCIYREMILRQQFNTRLRGMMLAYATGSDLDHLGALMGVTRLTLKAGDPAHGIEAQMESDHDLRYRIQLAPEGYSVAGPTGAYLYHALSSDADVLDASATSPSPGEVLITILSRSGDGTASDALCQRVLRVLSADTVRPLTDHVTVKPAQITLYAVDAVLDVFPGPDSSIVMANARTQLQERLRATQRLGRDIALSAIIAALHVEGVYRVQLKSPSADLVNSLTQAAFCQAITLNTVTADA